MTQTHSDSSIPTIEAELESAWPAARRAEITVIAAVSGGADSTALLCALAAISAREAARDPNGRRETILAAHFNHRWRGAESDEDEAFVRRLAAELGLECVVERAPSVSSGSESEDEARQARYRFLSHLAAERGARYVATAHTADDQAETVLFRIIRGTGLTGLAGIPAARSLNEMTTLIRPFLNVRRTEIEAYLRESEQTYRTDSSNADVRFVRNRLRREIMPLLEHIAPGDAVNSLVTLAKQADDVRRDTDERAEEWIAKSVRCHSDQTSFAISALNDGTPDFVLRTALIRLWNAVGLTAGEMTFARWERTLASLRTKAHYAEDFPGDVRCESNGETCRLFRRLREE